MTIPELLRWQWSGYSKNHLSRSNLLIHIFVVPLFWIGSIGLVTAAFERSLIVLACSLLAMIVSVALQGVGHKKETVPPEPFTSRFNAVSRIFLEQWITFPRFVVSGGWLRAWRQAS